jgi:hypothetical protein
VERFEVGQDGVVDLTGQVALHAPHDLWLGQSFLGPPLDIGAGAWAVAHAHHHGQVQGAVGVAITTAVQPVPLGSPAGGRDRRGATQVGEGGLTAEPVRVVAGGGEQLPGVLDADRQQPERAWRRLGDELGQPLVGDPDLLLQAKCFCP